MSTGSSSAARWSSSSPCSRSGRSSRPGPSGSRSHAGAVVVGLAAAGAPQGTVAGRPAIAGVARCNNFVAGIVLDEQAHGTTRLGGWRADGRGAGPTRESFQRLASAELPVEEVEDFSLYRTLVEQDPLP